MIGAKGEHLIGDAVSHYRLTERLGVGGMGVVYKAEDTRLGRHVALKFLPAKYFDDAYARERFQREARAASALDHPNICAIYDIDEQEGRPFIVMQYLEGRALDRRIQANTVPTDELLDIAIQVADALDRAHAQGIIHRDIKPANIFITRDGPKVLDFGLAKLTGKPQGATDTEAPTQVSDNLLTHPGTTVGTVNYMSPEQALGRELDARTDLFSLGVVLYEMATGSQPFRGDTSTEVIDSILHRSPVSPIRVNPEIPDELGHIIQKALEKDPRVRYQSAAELRADLTRLKRDRKLASDLRVETLAAGLSSPDRSETGASADAQLVVSVLRRHKWLVGTVLMAFLGAAVLAVWHLTIEPALILAETDEILITDFVNTTGNGDFDALKLALSVKLEESPYLNITPATAISATLRLMNRPPESRIDPDVGREICQRRNIKALLIGGIAQVGKTYLVTLNAENCQTGDSIAVAQARAQDPDGVLEALDEVASQMRQELGETLASIEETNTPVWELTTSSLQALKSWSWARQLQDSGRSAEAIVQAQRALELDPDFAMAHHLLFVIHWDRENFEAARESARRAYELRERASELERLLIEEAYHEIVEEDLDQAIHVFELALQRYPRKGPWHDVSFLYAMIGDHEKALRASQKAAEFNPAANTLNLLAWRYRWVNQFAQERVTLERALQEYPESWEVQSHLYHLALYDGDEQARTRQIEWFTQHSDVSRLGRVDRAILAGSGRFQKVRDLLDEQADALRRIGLVENAAGSFAGHGWREALVGNYALGEKYARQALDWEGSASSILRTSALTLAAAGRVDLAEELVLTVSEQFPKSTVWHGQTLPTIQARIQLWKGNPQKALELLRPAKRFEVSGAACIYTRGQALLVLQQAEEAAVEFQKILDQPGLARLWIETPLAHLGLARSKSLMGDHSAARKHYHDFFGLWKEADPDIPILIEARAEYARLPANPGS